MKTAYVTKTWTENTGGGSMVDFIELDSGRVITVNDETLAVWPSAQAFWDATSDTANKCEMHHSFEKAQRMNYTNPTTDRE